MKPTFPKKINIGHILEGIARATLTKTEAVSRVAAARKETCDRCPQNSEARKLGGHTTLRPDYHCTACGCNIRFKTHSMRAACPAEHWPAVDAITQTPDEEESYAENPPKR